MFMTNRVLPNLYYLREHADGSIEFVSSSQGTEDIARQQANLIGKDVIGETVVNFTRLKPVQGGCEWSSVMCVDIAGSIPDRLKKSGAEMYVRG